MPDLSPGQLDAVRRVLAIAAGSALMGAAGRTAVGALRTAAPRYDPPRAADPIVVDVPRPVAGPVPLRIPISARTREVKGAAANAVPEWLGRLPFGNRLWANIPDFTPPFGGADAATSDQVPAWAAAAVPAAAAGLAGGYHLTDRLLRAADRRRARADLEAAQQEYQDAVLGRARQLHLGDKAAAVLVDGGAVADPVLGRVKAAIDRAYAAAKRAAGVGVVSPVAVPPAPLPPPGPQPTVLPPAPAAVAPPPPAPDAPPPPPGGIVPGFDRVAVRSSRRTHPRADGEKVGGISDSPGVKALPAGNSPAARSLASLLWPGLWADKWLPGAAAVNMGLAGTMAGLGGLAGYRAMRDPDAAETVRREVERADRANATAVPAPMIARIVPVPAG